MGESTMPDEVKMEFDAMEEEIEKLKTDRANFYEEMKKSNTDFQTEIGENYGGASADKNIETVDAVTAATLKAVDDTITDMENALNTRKAEWGEQVESSKTALAAAADSASTVAGSING